MGHDFLGTYDLFADALLLFERGVRVESRVQSGESIPGGHLRAWRIAREEVLANVMRWIRLVIANFFAFTGKVIHEDRQLHTQLPDELWNRVRNFLESLSHLPC